MTATAQDIQSILDRTSDAMTGQPFAKMVQQIEAVGQGWRLTLQTGFPVARSQDRWLAPLKQALQAAGIAEVEMVVQSRVQAHKIRPGIERVAGVKNIIAVASGKGGVGKSTTAVNLTLALKDEGAKVGLLDADIYGPSVPLLLNMSGKPDSLDGKTMEPMIGHGVKSNSIGYLIDANEPAIWRGPMVTQALEQLLRQTNWGELDYLIIDMPPGTGDVALTLAQRVPVTAAVVVTTPQDMALIDARKGAKMFEKVDVPVLGLVENMAVHVCTQCGHTEHLFGQGGGAQMAQEFGVPMLGSLPLTLAVREDADAGCPTVVKSPDSEVAQLYRDVACQMAARLAVLPRDMSSKIPTVVVAKR